MNGSGGANRSANRLPLKGVIDYVEPTKNAVKDHPKNGMLDAPRNGYSEHASETPKADARRPASVFHIFSRISVVTSQAGSILHQLGI
jgi:hypothetical protein